MVTPNACLVCYSQGMPKAGDSFYISTARAEKLRKLKKLSPSEFQVFLAIRELGNPTIRELQEFLAKLPPLSVVLEKHPEAVLDTHRKRPTYNNVNTTLLRMQEAGAVSFLVPYGGGERRLMTLWPLAETIAHCIHVALRDFLAFKEANSHIVPAIVQEIAARCLPEELPGVETQLHREITSSFAQMVQEGLPRTHPWTLDRESLRHSRKASTKGPAASGEDLPKRKPGRPRRTTPAPPRRRTTTRAKRLVEVAPPPSVEGTESSIPTLASEPPVSTALELVHPASPETQFPPSAPAADRPVEVAPRPTLSPETESKPGPSSFEDAGESREVPSSLDGESLPGDPNGEGRE